MSVSLAGGWLTMFICIRAYFSLFVCPICLHVDSRFQSFVKIRKEKVKKNTLINLIINTPETPDFSVLTSAITSLNDMVNGFKKEVASNSATSVQLKCVYSRGGMY